MSFSLSSKRFVSIGAVIVILGIVIWFALFRSDKPQEVTKESVSTGVSTTTSSNAGEVVFPVEVAIAHRGDLVKRLSTTGIIRANREVEIVARTAGEIVFVGAQNGEYVKQGDILVKLDDRDYRLAFERAASVLLAAQIEYRTLSTSPFIENPDSVALRQKIEVAQEKLREAERRYRERTLPEEDFLRLKRDYETDLAVYKAQRSDVVASKSGLSQAREGYERAKMNLEWTEIKAPFSGCVADCDLSLGMQVQTQKVVMKLVDVSSLLVDVEVLESEVGKIQIGRKAEVAVNAYPNQSFAGKIVRINPIVDPKSKTVKATIELKDSRPLTSAPSATLRPGMFSTVKLETDILPNRLLVPKDALLVRDQRTLVFIAQAGLAKWQYVDVGDENEKFIEVRSGMTAGDTVIVGGHYTLAHDARIRVEKGRDEK